MSNFRDKVKLGDETLSKLEAFCLYRKKLFYPKSDLSPEELDALTGSGKEQATTDLRALAEACSKLLGERVVSATSLETTGTFHSLYRITLAATATYICRVSLLSDPHPAFHFLTDSWTSEVMSQKSVPTATVCMIDLSREDYPLDYEIMIEAKGRPLKTLEDPDTQFIAPELLAQLGQYAAAIHEVGTRDFGLIDVRSMMGDADARARGLAETWEDYILLRLDEHIGTCVEIGAINGAEASRIETVFTSASHVLHDAPSRLLHGDLGGHNVLVDADNITAIVDWEDALCGDPLFDIAYWGTFGRDYWREPFLEGYRRAQTLPEDFERRYWLYYLRVALAKTVHRHRFGYADHPGRPPASLRIQKGLKRFEANI